MDVLNDPVCLPGRPWLVGGCGTVCLVRVDGRPLVPIFRSATAAREFLARQAAGASDFYPLFPDAADFVPLLAAAMRGGAGGYVFIDAGGWHVIPFAAHGGRPVGRQPNNEHECVSVAPAPAGQ